MNFKVDLNDKGEFVEGVIEYIPGTRKHDDRLGVYFAYEIVWKGEIDYKTVYAEGPGAFGMPQDTKPKDEKLMIAIVKSCVRKLITDDMETIEKCKQRPS